jgi:hypothetical protein
VDCVVTDAVQRGVATRFGRGKQLNAARDEVTDVDAARILSKIKVIAPPEIRSLGRMRETGPAVDRMTPALIDPVILLIGQEDSRVGGGLSVPLGSVVKN